MADTGAKQIATIIIIIIIIDGGGGGGDDGYNSGNGS